LAREEVKPAGVLSLASKAVSAVNVRPQPESGSKLAERERLGGESKKVGRKDKEEGGTEKQ